MTITATYDDTEALGRVRLNFSGYSTDADYATVERSTDQINWTLVRGGDKAALSGGAGHLDDYEFQANVQNYYRVTAIDGALMQPLTSGAMAVGNNATLTPALPTGVVAGAMMVLKVAHTNTAASITTPTGWTRVLSGASHFGHFWKIYAPGDTAPSVAFSGGAAGDSCSAQVLGWTNAQAPVHVQMLTNASAQNVDVPGASTNTHNRVWLMDTWKKSTASGATAPSGFGDQQGSSVTAGANPQTHLSWRTAAEADIQTVLAQTLTFSGGSAAISKSRLLYMDARPYTDQEIGSITPVVTRYRLKNPSRPGLNTFIEITDLSAITRRSRTGKFDVLGRTMPVAVTDVASSREFTFEIYVEGNSVAEDMDNRLAGGEPLFLQGPGGEDDDVPTLYFVAGDVTKTRLAFGSKSITFTIPATEVAKPGATVYGDTFIWNDVVNTYADWNAVVAGVTTWSNLVDKITQQDVIVN